MSAAPPPRGCPVAVLLLLVFTVVPLCELSILVWLTYRTTFLFTLALVLTSGILGATLARWQGVRVWRQASQEMAMGRFPADPLLDGLIIFMGGALLVTPGLITDVVGISTLVPPVRAIYRARLKAFFKSRINRPGGGGSFRVYTFGGGIRPGTEPEPDSPKPTPFDEPSPFDRIGKE